MKATKFKKTKEFFNVNLFKQNFLLQTNIKIT